MKEFEIGDKVTQNSEFERMWKGVPKFIRTITKIDTNIWGKKIVWFDKEVPVNGWVILKKLSSEFLQHEDAS